MVVIFLAVVMVKNYLGTKQENEGNQGLPAGQTVLNSALWEQLILLDNPYFGEPTAKVKIVEFADFTCSSCRRLFPVLRRIMNEYQNQIFVSFHNYLLSEDSELSAEAGWCAGEQNKFWPLHDLMFQNQSRLKEETKIKILAMQAGLDVEKFENCLTINKYSARAQSDTAEGILAGVAGTQTLFINGYKLTGAGTEESLRAVIEKILNNK